MSATPLVKWYSFIFLTFGYHKQDCIVNKKRVYILLPDFGRFFNFNEILMVCKFTLILPKDKNSLRISISAQFLFMQYINHFWIGPAILLLYQNESWNEEIQMLLLTLPLKIFVFIPIHSDCLKMKPIKIHYNDITKNLNFQKALYFPLWGQLYSA